MEKGGKFGGKIGESRIFSPGDLRPVPLPADRIYKKNSFPRESMFLVSSLIFSLSRHRTSNSFLTLGGGTIYSHSGGGSEVSVLFFPSTSNSPLHQASWNVTPAHRHLSGPMKVRIIYIPATMGRHPDALSFKGLPFRFCPRFGSFSKNLRNLLPKKSRRHTYISLAQQSNAILSSILPQAHLIQVPPSG